MSKLRSPCRNKEPYPGLRLYWKYRAGIAQMTIRSIKSVGCYRSLSRYVKIRSSTNGISYDKNLLLTCRNMGTLLYYRLENTVSKGEIARFEQFPPFPQWVSKDLYCRKVQTRACLRKSKCPWAGSASILFCLCGGSPGIISCPCSDSTSTLSFPVLESFLHNVFYPIIGQFNHLVRIEFCYLHMLSKTSAADR